MDTKSVTLQIPEPLYERYKQLAEQTHRSVEDELLDAVSHSAPSDKFSHNTNNGISTNQAIIPERYRNSMEEIEAELAEILTPEELAEMDSFDLDSLTLPPSAKTSAEIIREDRDRY